MPLYPRSSAHVFGLQTSFNLIIDVVANLLTAEKPQEAIDYFSLQVGRLNEELKNMHPEYLNSLFDRASVIFSQNASAGIKLYSALQVALFHD